MEGRSSGQAQEATLVCFVDTIFFESCHFKKCFEKMLKKESLVTNIRYDTADNEPSEVTFLMLTLAIWMNL